MRYVFIVMALVLSLATASLCQSGRRTASPTPTPAPAPGTRSIASPVGYSESAPRPPRTVRPTAVPLSATVLAPAQNAKPDDTDSDTLKVETNLVTIPVSVYDRNGLYIPG